jgi:hypothetical protein
MSIQVVVSSTAAGVSVSGGTAVAIAVSSVSASVPITISGGIGPAGFIVDPGTASSAFGTFQLAAGDGITISTSVGQFQIASYGTAAVASLAPVQSVAGRVGAVQLQASDVTAGTFAIARIPTISYTALANVPATFSPAAHTHSTSDVVSFPAAAAAAAPVQSVAGRSGAISLTAADVSGLASVATSGSYTSLQNVPATFAPAAHTHSTADITGITASFAAAGHTHSASAIASGVLELARIPTIGYTALSGVPSTFSPQAHTHSTADVVGLTASFSQVGHTHDYAATIHTHSTADIVGITASFAASSHTHDAAAIASGVINVARLPANVSALNTLTGGITIAAGANVTVSTASSTITIAAGGGGGGSANIVEAATAAGFPATGASGTLYHATDVKKIFFWDAVGSFYVEAGPSGGGGGGVSGLTWSSVPASDTATATAGSIAYDGTFFYVAVDTNQWRRSALSRFTDPFFASVSLLLHMDGIGSAFVDSSGSPKSITAVGNATQSATQSKWGGRSGAFNGSSDFLTISSHPTIGTQDFTIEFWLFSSDQSALQAYVDFRPRGTGSPNGAYPTIYSDGSAIYYYVNAANRLTGTMAGTGQWQHIAISRSGGSTNLYVNGTRQGSTYTDTTDYAASLPVIGAAPNGLYANAYIDDVRITVGSSGGRGYTGSSITVPAAAFPDS